MDYLKPSILLRIYLDNVGVFPHYLRTHLFFFSNSRRRHESEEGDSHRRHKHKKSKRSKEGKEAGSEPAPEQESTEAAPAE